MVDEFYICKKINSDKVPTKYINNMQRVSTGPKLQIEFCSWGISLCVEIKSFNSVQFISNFEYKIKFFLSHNRLTNG